MEYEADNGAIFLLCKYYLYHVASDESVNICTIASFFGLEEEFYSDIEKCLRFIIN